MSNESNFKIMLQAMLDKVKSIFNIKKDITAIQPQLPKVKFQGTLDKAATQKELNAKIKSIKPKVKLDADTTQAEKKIKKIEKQKTKTTIAPTVDNTKVVSGLKQAQKETKTLWEKFTSGIIGANLVRMAVQRVTQAIREAIVTVKELDTIKTNIQMVSGTSDLGVNAMMPSYNDMAKNLSSTTKDVAEAANEFLRMGESIANTNELIRSSQILSKVGMIDSANAASYLISSLKGYQVAAEDSIDIVSKLTSVDLEAAVSSGGLAEALSKCANIANNSGVSMDRLIGYTATVGETTQKSMSEVGNSFQALLSRMNNIKIGRFIDDDTGESLADTEAVLNKLGIQLRDTENTYRSFDDVLDDVGSRWKSFTKVEQNALSVAIAGTRQRENFEALMNNWGNALKYSETAANSAGSALERYGVYQDSIEAKTNELTAALESLSTNIVSEELYSGIIEATTGIVEFLDKTNLLKASLAGLVAMEVSKVIASMGTGFITAANSTKQLTAAMALFDNQMNEDNLRRIGQACIGLSDNQLKLVLSTKGLINEDRKLILEGKGVAEAEREQTLATLGFANAENVATASTFSLKGAWNALKTAFLSSPVGWVTAAIAAVGLLTKGYLTLTESAERCKERADELMSSFKSALDEANSNAKTVEDLAAKYERLSKGVNNLGENVSLTTDEYTEYNKIVNQIADMFPTLIKGYTDEGNAILSLKGNVEELRDTYKEAQMEAYNLLIVSGKDSDGNDILKDANNVINHAKMGGLFGKGATLGGNKQTIEYIDEISKIFSQDDYKDILLAKTGLGTSLDPSDDDEVFRAWFTYLTGISTDGWKYISDITDEQVTEIIKQLKISKQALNAEINSAVDNVETLANAYLMTNEDYAKLDEQSKNAASIIINSLNADIVSSFGENKENVGKYVDNIVQTISTNPEIQDALVGLFSLDTINLPVNEAKSLIDTYIEYIAKEISEDPLELEVRLGFDDTIDTAKRLQNSIRQITDDHGISDRKEYATLSEYTKDFTQEQTELWLKATLGAQDAAEAIQMYKDKLTEIKSIAPASFSDIFSLKGTDDTITNLGKISESIDTIQNAYKTLNDAIDEYNEEGAFSVDTLQSVIALGDDWLDYLVDEDGALKLDKESLEQLTQARLNDMRVQAINSVIDNVSKIESDADANEYLKTTNYALAESYEEVAQKALESARAKMQDAVAAGTLSQANMDAAMDKATADISKINKLFANTSISGDSIMGGGGSSSGGSSSTSEFQETIDFFERRVEVLDNALSHLDSTLDNVAGSFGKNNLIDAELGITEEKFNNYTDALAMYTQKANEAFSKIPADIASRVKDGAVALTDFIGDGNEDVVEAIKDYESWADKISSCQQELAELKKEIRQLELEKFNNIMDDFQNQFNLRGDSKDLISKQIDLLKEAGELIGESFFTTQIDQSKKQLELLEAEKAQLVNQMSSAISSGRVNCCPLLQ